jgi:transmembrane sensor
MNTEDSSWKDSLEELAERIAYLINGFIQDDLTESEHDELDEWVSANMKNQRLFEELINPVNIQKWVNWREKLDSKAAFERVKEKVGIQQDPGSFKKRRIWPYWVAAATIITIIVIGDLWYNKAPALKQQVAFSKQDIPPGGPHAILKMNGGPAIILDTSNSGKIITNGSVSITKDSSVLIYAATNKKDGPPRMDELSTPAGGEYQLSLSDGTRVWLNASTTLRYPEQFPDSVRRVEVTGEAYFEVAKNAKHPFIVEAGKNEVRVLGTHFNVNHYPDNHETIVTLAEGSVKLNGSVLLKPGEQGVISPDGKMVMESADLESALAWKDGQFIFKMAPLDQVMAQVSHWYDAKIVYKDNNTDHFNARIPRDVPVSKLLHLLEATGRVHFKVEYKTITVMN